MKTGEGYGWAALSQWDMPPFDAYIETKLIETPLSKAYCRFMLVKRTDQGEGFLRCEHVNTLDVTEQILDEAGEI